MEGDARERFRKNVSQYDYIRFSLCDIQGRALCKLIPARNVHEFIDVGCENAEILCALGPLCEPPDNLTDTPPAEYHFPNGTFVPVLDTLHDLPWAGDGKHKIGSVQCEMRWLDGSPQQACPRTAARKQVEQLRELGFTLMSGVETEFAIYKQGTKNPLYEGFNFCNSRINAKYEPFFCALDEALFKMGLNTFYQHVELDPGQVEFTFQPKYGIRTAEETHLLRQAVKEMTEQRGWDYNFMSKPKDGITNGSHFNLSLWDLKGQKNVFYDADKPDKISDVCKYFVGGLLKHSGAVTAFCCPTVNCYRRMHQPFAPGIANWAVESRSAAINLKNHSAKSARIENRIPSGLSNPYLVTAVTLAAGIDGIRNKIEPPPALQKDAGTLPSTLEEALQQLEGDTVMCEALGPQLVKWFVEIKRQFEVKPLEGFDPKVFTEEDQNREWAKYAKL